MLDSDETKIIQIPNINDISTLQELMHTVKVKFRLPNMDESLYGFKTKFEKVLLQGIGDIRKHTDQGPANFMRDKS